MADPFGGNAAIPGNLGAMSPQMMAAYVRLLQQREKPEFKPSHSWADIPAGIVTGLVEAKERKQLNDALAGMSQQTPADTVPSLSGDGNPATTGAPPQKHDGTVYDDRNVSGGAQGGDILAQIAAHEISPTDKARLESGGKVFPYADGRQTSIGFGTRAQPGDNNGINAATAGQRLQSEVKNASDSVHAFAPNAPYGWHKALTDLTYNVGPGWQKAGLGKAVQAGDWDTAKQIYPQYNKVDDGKGNLRPSTGLSRRRADFLSGVDQQAPGALQPTPGEAAGVVRDITPGAPGAAAAGAPASTPGEAASAPAAAPGGPAPGAPAGAAPPLVARMGKHEDGSPGLFIPDPNRPGKHLAITGPGLPPMPGAVEQFQRDRAMVQALLRHPIGTPERARGEALAADLQKRLEKSAYTDPNTGQQYYGNDVTGRQPATGMPRTPTPAELEEGKITASKLSEGRVVPITEAIAHGQTAQRAKASLNMLDAIGSMPGAENMNVGPFAQVALHAKQALQDATGIDLGGIGPAEGISKLNVYLGLAASRELTNRPTQFDFKTFLENNPGLTLSNDGRKMLTDILRQTSQQDIDIARMAAKVRTPEDTRNWQDKVDEYYSSHPVIVHYRGKVVKSADAIEGAAAPASAPPPGAPPALRGSSPPAPAPPPRAGNDAMGMANALAGVGQPATPNPTLQQLRDFLNRPAIGGNQNESAQSRARKTIRNIGPQPNEAGLIAGAHEPTNAEMYAGAAAPFIAGPAAALGGRAAVAGAASALARPHGAGDWVKGAAIFEIMRHLMSGGH